MKLCDQCGKIATVYYRVTVNGKTEQKHLCADCAEKANIPLAFPSPLELAFSLPFGGLFEQPATPLAPTPERRSPDLPRGFVAAPERAPAPEAEEALPMQLPTLKAQLKRALREDDYLRAAALRDQIRALEGK